MKMAHRNHETEIKLRVPDLKTARRILYGAGFHVAKRRIFESNSIFDTPELTLRRNVSLLRVREAGGAKLTYKGRPEQSKHKSREELEIEVSDPATMSTILERIGFHRTFRYEKYRTEFQPRTGNGVATLDETPIGTFLELEGAPSWIDRTAKKMGFSESDYITDSYGRLYLEWCREHNITPSDMVFAKKAR
jgi:adenylate cyclase, class 2